MKRSNSLSRAIATLILLGACAALALAQTSSCRVDQALQAKSAAPLPPEFKSQCPTSKSCTGYINCASIFISNLKPNDPRLSNPNWLDTVTFNISAVLDKLPSSQLNPDTIVYYFDFIVMVEAAEVRSDQMCTEANVQIRNLSPMLLLLEKPPAERNKLLNSKQFDKLQGISDRYKVSRCYDSTVLSEAMNPPKAQTDEALAAEAIHQLLREIAQVNQQQNAHRNNTNAENSISSALVTGGNK